MPYDDIINSKQGSIKTSEVFMDRSLDIIKNSIGETTLKTLEGMMKPIGDAIRYNNFLLHSDGQIIWETVSSQPRIRFDADAKANNIRLRLMMLDESAASRTVDIIIPATTGANSLTGFNTINMNNNDLIYMELSRSVILAALSGTPASTPAVITLENGITGSSVTSGRRLLKVNMTGNTGMPAMVADLDSILQDASQTVNIPIASRYDWTDGISTYSDIWWIPHGIRWPTGSISVIGAVVVSGFNALPTYFARTITELNQQLTLLTTIGGMIAIIAPITINSPLTVPAGVTLIGRTTKNDNTSPGLYFGSGGRLNLNARSQVRDLYIRVLAGFGQIAPENVIDISAAGCVVSGNFFEFVSATSTQARAINFATGAQDFRIRDNLFTSISASTVALQFAATSYARANLSSNQFTTIIEAAYTTRAAALNVNNSYGIVPVGTILPWVGAAFTNGSNGSPASIAASFAALATMLPEGWVICDGRSLPTDSPLRTGGNTFTPNLTDRFVLGVNALSSGAIGGTNTVTLSTANLPSHSHDMTHGHSHTLAASGSFASGSHTHLMRHVHQWAYESAQTQPGGVGTLRTSATADTTKTSITASDLEIMQSSGYDSGPQATGSWRDSTSRGSRNLYTSGVINPPAGSAGTTANTGTPSDGSFSPVITGSITNFNGSTGGAGSGSAFSVQPSYITAIYIMRYK